MSPKQDQSGRLGTVLLLHGFAGLPIMTRPLARMLRRAGFDARELGYDSWGTSLGEICGKLAPRLARIASASDGPLHIVGHSMGGLVARALIHRHKPANLGHVVMLGTPNGGSEIADFAMQWPPLRPILGRAGATLVTRRASSIDALLGKVDYSLGIIAGDRPMPPATLARFVPGPNDGKVSVTSTRLPDATDHIVLPLSHMSLLYHARAHRQVRHYLIHGRFDAREGRDRP